MPILNFDKYFPTYNLGLVGIDFKEGRDHFVALIDLLSREHIICEIHMYTTLHDSEVILMCREQVSEFL